MSMEPKKNIIHSNTFEKHYEKILLKKDQLQDLFNIKIKTNNEKFKEKVQETYANVKEESTLEFPFAAFIGTQRTPYLCYVRVVKKNGTNYIYLESIDENIMFGKDFSKLEPLLFETISQLVYNLLVPSKIIQAPDENKINHSTSKFFIHFDGHLYLLETSQDLEISKVIKMEVKEND
jgi:hypothetical protein